MGKGLITPVGVNQGGGAALEEDPLHLNTILRNALLGGGDDNPFQNLGLDLSIIFSVNNDSAKGVARSAVNKVLAKFRDRLRLVPNTQIEIRQVEGGQVELSFQYINLDNNQAQDFQLTFN